MPLFAAVHRLSCGVVIVNDAAELLLCRVTGRGHWDLPKGGAQPGETPLQAALRETHEETGLRLPAAALTDLGAHAHAPGLRLHLFATRLHRVDPRTLRCDSHFTCRASGRRLPEMDGFGWFAFDRVRALCVPRMAHALTHHHPLPALLRRLQGSGTPAPA